MRLSKPGIVDDNKISSKVSQNLLLTLSIKPRLGGHRISELDKKYKKDGLIIMKAHEYDDDLKQNISISIT